LSKSVALKAEGIHSLSDSLASFIGFISIYMSEKKHEKFPYGLYKLENIGAMFISFFYFSPPMICLWMYSLVTIK